MNDVILIVFAAPSGAGKTTIVRHLLQTFDALSFSVSATTRRPRSHEMHGRDYYFLSRDEWDERMATGAFLEWEEVYEGQYYGTLKSEIDRLQALGKRVIFDIDVKGAMNIKAQYGAQALTIFVQPPSPEILFQRLRDRNTESAESLQKRIDRAGEELTYADQFDVVLLNDDLSTALSDATALIQKVLATS